VLSGKTESAVCAVHRHGRPRDRDQRGEGAPDGLKDQKKLYRRYTGFPGGLREESFTRLINRKPEKVLEEAIKGMLPKSKMGRPWPRS
jgi:hypothetical protein